MYKGIALILQIALDTPLRRTFDYLAPDLNGRTPAPGVRVKVPFGRRQLIGVLTGIAEVSSVPADKLKAAGDVLDDAPVFDATTLELLRWASDYYHHPLGEVIAAALPVALREGQAADDSAEIWTLSEAGREQLASAAARRAPRQRALLARLAEGAATSEALGTEFARSRLRILQERGWAEARRVNPEPAAFELRPSEVTLTDEQALVVEAITRSLGGFTAHLLCGVTGSGKTEVYLRAIAAALAGGGQALVLVPEIALTPQLVDRFRRRFSAGVVVMHSGLPGTERRDAWRSAHGGRARIVHRHPLRRVHLPAGPSLIVVDEEHDVSYKQHEGFRYPARDLAVCRAQRARRADRPGFGDAFSGEAWRCRASALYEAPCCRTVPGHCRRPAVGAGRFAPACGRAGPRRSPRCRPSAGICPRADR